MIPIIIVMNSVGLLVAGYDKIAAKLKLRRIRERNFVILSLLLGGLGVFAGFILFRHKTRHTKLFFSVGLIAVAEYLLILCGADLFFP